MHRTLHQVRTVQAQGELTAFPDSFLLASRGSPPPDAESLDEWEAGLVRRLPGIRLLGELDLTRDDLGRLSGDIRQFVLRVGPQAASEALLDRYPTAAACLLVFTGIYDYQHGIYWEAIDRRIGRRRIAWGTIFEAALKRHRLEAFPEFDEESALRYVSRILAHGGIPDYSLLDYFSFIARISGRGEWRSASASALIADWDEHDFNVRQIDKPVQRFLRHGSHVAEDFLQRSLEMMETALTSGSAPAASEFGLPERLTAPLAKWLESRSGDIITERRQRGLKSPNLIYDPWGIDKFVFEFPSQVISHDAYTASWSLRTDESSDRWPTRVRRGKRTESMSAEAVIPQPSGKWTASFQVNETDVNSWHFAGRDAARPLIAFDPDTGHLLRWSHGLAARDLWLIFPSSNDVHTVSTDGIDKPLPIIERLPRLHGGWRQYTAVWVDLAPCSAVCMRVTGDRETDVKIPVIHDESATARPIIRLDEVSISGIWATSRQLPVVSKAPRIVIPAETWSDDREAAIWFITVIPSDGSRPSERSKVRVSDLAWSNDETGRVIIDLGQRALLPATSLGTFSVNIRGPLGTDSRSTFSMVPGLQLSGHEPHQMLTRHEGEPATIDLTADVPFTLRKTSDEVFSEQRDGGVELRTSSTHIDLGISSPDDAEVGMAAVDLVIPVPTVRWAVIDGNHLVTPAWSTTALTISQDELMSLEDPVLLVEGMATSSSHGRPLGTARLVLYSGRREVLQDREVTVRAARCAIPLNVFYDTIRNRHDATLNFVLSIWDADDRPLVIERSAIRPTRHFEPLQVSVSDELITSNGVRERQVRVLWSQRHPIRGRELRIWSLTRPWDRPITASIPDDCEDEFVFTCPASQFPAGKYRFEIGVVDPWSLLIPEMPKLGAGLIDADLGTDESSSNNVAQYAPVSSRLEAFFRGNNPGVLDGVRQSIPFESVQCVLEIFFKLIHTEESDIYRDETIVKAAIRELRDGLLHHPGLFPYLAKPSLIENQASSRFPGLSEIIAAIGLPQQSTRFIHRRVGSLPPAEKSTLQLAYPLFFLCSVSDKLAQSPIDLDIANRIFGSREIALLVDGAAPQMARDVAFGDPVLNRFIYSPDPSISKCDILQLRAISSALPSDPSGLLSEANYLASVLECFIRLKDPTNHTNIDRLFGWAADVAARALASLDQVELIIDEDPRFVCTELRQAIQVIRSRYDDSLVEHELIPFAVGATALIQRLLSRLTLVRARLASSADFWLETGRAVAAVAPRLYLHDLCLCDLLLFRCREAERHSSYAVTHLERNHGDV